MAYEWLDPQEAVLRFAAPDTAPLEVGALCFFDAAPLLDRRGRLRLADLRRHVEARLGHVPRFRQIVVTSPLGQGRPAWVDDPHFDIANHVHAAALPHPGGRDELCQFMRRLLDTPLDPTRPLWEIWLVEGVDGGRVALVPKVSHVAADGTAVLGFALSLLDLEPDRHPSAHVQPWTPTPAPSAAALLAGSVLDDVRRQLASAAGAMSALARPDRLLSAAVGSARAAAAMAGRAPRLSMTRPTSGHHDFAWVGLPLDRLRAVARARGVKLNDVVVTVVAEALAARTARGATRARIIVPVSTHVPGGSDAMRNSYSLMIADVPVGPMSPAARLDLVHGELERCKGSSQAGLGSSLFSLGSIVPPAVLRRTVPALLRRQPFANLAVTNLAGSPVPLYLLGAKMLAAYPFVSLVGNVGMIIGVLSHDGELCTGITVDPNLVGDVDAFADDLGRACIAVTAPVDGRHASSRTASRMARMSSP